MTGVEYRNSRREETLKYSAGILKHHDILINIIPSQNMYGQTIDQSDNLVHGMIGTMSCCNNGLGSIGFHLFV